jgi:hypothetical protein
MPSKGLITPTSGDFISVFYPWFSLAEKDPGFQVLNNFLDKSAFIHYLATLY